MTTIIGLQTDTGCSIYADGQTTGGTRSYFHNELRKIHTRNGYLLAAAGPARPTDVINFQWKPPSWPPELHMNEYAFMVTRVIPSLQQALTLNGCEEVGEEFSMLIALRGNLFEIGCDFSVLVRDDGIYGIGSGAPYAIGILWAGVSITVAMAAASANDIYSGGITQAVFQEKP
jgi:ATP-dependent protease HslVU (ClpYQ) peptidase subunit